MGCARLESFDEGNSWVPPAEVARLSPGDTVGVRFYSHPELNEDQAIRPDGKIAMQLVGEIAAAGKTVEELRQALLAAYQDILKEPQVSVVVREWGRRQVFVLGEVRTPGAVPHTGRLTVLEAIGRAGGFDLRTAEPRSVVVLRQGPDGRRKGYSVNMKAALKGRQTRPHYLAPLDVVFVPQTGIAKVNQWIDQHIDGILPDIGVGFTTQRNGNWSTTFTVNPQ